MRTVLLTRADLEAKTVEYSAARRPGHVNLARLCLPVDECPVVALGPVDASVLTQWGHRSSTVVIVECEGVGVGWGLVDRVILRGLHRRGVPLSPDDVVRFARAGLATAGALMQIEELLAAFASRTSSIVHEPVAIQHLRGRGQKREQLEIYGLLTVSELNTLEVRRGLYELLVEVEEALVRQVRINYPKRGSWMGLIKRPKERRDLQKRIIRLTREHVLHDPTGLLSLMQLLEIACRTKAIRREMGFESEKAVRRELGGVGKLRNRVMHPAGVLIRKHAEVAGFASTAKWLREVLVRLNPAGGAI